MRPLPDRQPHFEAREAMAAASGNLSRESFQEQVKRCEKAFLEATGHKHVELTESGSDAIFQVLSAIDGSTMVPDQGIWKGTLNHCRQLGVSTPVLSTNLGAIDPETLKKAIEKHDPTALFITSFAGYVAEQDIKSISRICRKHDVLLIEDASSSIGDDRLAKGKHSDVIVGSARTPKLLGLDSGGFITTSNKDIAERVEKLNRTFTQDPSICAGIAEALKNAPTTIAGLSEFSESLKKSLENVVHKEKRGVCVGVLMNDPRRFSRKARHVGHVTHSGKSLFTTCPRYDRFLEKGVVVEVKKLDVEAISYAEMESISNFIREVQET
jgi:aspartate aminotransferase-like enzyme